MRFSTYTPRSYTVETPSRELRWNHSHLRVNPESNEETPTIMKTHHEASPRRIMMRLHTGMGIKLPETIWLKKRDVLWSSEPHCCWEGQRHLRQKDTFSSDLGEIASTTWGTRIALDDYCIGIRYTLADMPSDPHLKGQTCILASQPAFSCWKFELPLMEWPAF